MALAGMEPDPWQAEVLRSDCDRRLLLCCRQAGKSSVASAMALRTAFFTPDALVLLLSPSLRQSGELFRKVTLLYERLGRPVEAVSESSLQMQLSNGARIVSLPGTEETIRGYSGASLLIIDEASRVSEALYFSVRPMLAVSQGGLVCLSTPFGKRGFFYEEWTGENRWQRTKVKATDCPRIPAEFLEEERRALGERWFNQEYMVSFEDAIDAVFSEASIEAALNNDLKPLFGE